MEISSDKGHKFACESSFLLDESWSLGAPSILECWVTCFLNLRVFTPPLRQILNKSDPQPLESTPLLHGFIRLQQRVRCLKFVWKEVTMGQLPPSWADGQEQRGSLVLRDSDLSGQLSPQVEEGITSDQMSVRVPPWWADKSPFIHDLRDHGYLAILEWNLLVEASALNTQ